MRRENIGNRTNRLISQMAGRVDGETSAVAQRAVALVAALVRFARFPAYALLLAVLMFAGGTALIAFAHDGVVWRVLAILATGVVAFVAFVAWRVASMVRAVSDRERLTTEVGIALQLSGRVDDTRQVLEQIGGPSSTMFGRLRGLWRAGGLGARWIEGIGDLPRARWFFPPTIGVTVVAGKFLLMALPISFVALVLTGIAALAR